MVTPENKKATNGWITLENWMYNLAFWLPVLLFAIGIYLLWNGRQVPVSDNQEPSQTQNSVETGISMNIKVEGKIGSDTITTPCCVTIVEKEAETKTGEVEIQTPSNEAYQYFLLGSIIFIVLLVLPRLKELTISKDSISIVLQDVLNDFKDLQSQIQVKEEFRTQGTTTDFNDKVKNIENKLELINKIINRE